MRYLSVVSGDVLRAIIAWTLCANMRAKDGTDTLNLVPAAPGYIAGALAQRAHGAL